MQDSLRSHARGKLLLVAGSANARAASSGVWAPPPELAPATWAWAAERLPASSPAGVSGYPWAAVALAWAAEQRRAGAGFGCGATARELLRQGVLQPCVRGLRSGGVQAPRLSSSAGACSRTGCRAAARELPSGAPAGCGDGRAGARPWKRGSFSQRSFCGFFMLRFARRSGNGFLLPYSLSSLIFLH
jgi:hypothetical protein